EGKDILAPAPDTELAMGDKLLIVSKAGQILDEFHQEQPKKIVLVDDNPVIRRLYTRLFQKAGFNIITSSTGREGCEMILREQPDGAVVDYLLSDISGLEVCEAVRESENGQNVKLFLFTADEAPELRKNAEKVGVDMVVLKSPDAAEIVNLVRDVVESGKENKRN
ncbi:MAG TPA: response regulator, partial [Desulfobacterales bacterium]|nr:response regulator [Desulfobacterales bacterium]